MVTIVKIGRYLLDFLYFFIKLIPMQRKVTMISRQSNTPSVDFQMIKNELNRQDPKVKVALLCKTIDGGEQSSINVKIKYAFHVLRQMFHIASSKVVILDTYCIPISFLHHKKKLTVIQMWHSMGTMKQFGYTALDKKEGTRHALAYAMRMHENYDYVFASSENYKSDLANGFHCDISKIITMPLPRLDLLQSKKYKAQISKKIYQQYSELEGKPVILYCPTFRKNEKQLEQALYQLLDELDTEKYAFVVKLHPLSKITLKPGIICAEDFSSFEMLFIADYVISDYSCIVYEAAILQIPLYFYNFDMDEYTEERGLAIDYYKELPGVIASEAREIAQSIKERSYDMEEVRKFAEKYVSPTTHATEDIANFVLQFLE